MSAPDAAPAPSFDFFVCCDDFDREAVEALQTALLSRSPGRSYFWNPPPVSGPSVDKALEAILGGSRLVVMLVTSNTAPDFFERYEVRRAGELAGEGKLTVVAVTIDLELEVLGLLDRIPSAERLDARQLGSTRAVADALCRIAGVPLPERHPPSVELVDELERLLSYRARHAHSEDQVAAVVPRIEQLAQEIAIGAEINEGDVVAGARLSRPLGSDSFSYTWYAKREATSEPCVVKVFRLERLTSGMMLWGFRNAERALATLNEHPNAPRSIVRLLEVSSDTLAFCTEYLPEGTLEHVQSRGWPLERRVGLFAQVCAAVEFAHGLGIVHGDIKPTNISLNADGRAVLTDFALSAPRLIPESSKSYARVAAPMYMPPELRDEEATESSDIYSLGRLLHYLLIERTPPPQLEAEPTLESLERFPPSLVAIVRRATRLDPAHRYVSVKEMLADLEVHRTGGTVVAVPLPEVVRPPGTSAPAWLRSPAVMGAAGLMALVLLLVWAVSRQGPPQPAVARVAGTAVEAPPPPTAPRTPTAPAAPVDARVCRSTPLSCQRAEWKDAGGMAFVRVCAGVFCMGSGDGDELAQGGERPAHGVAVPEFWIGRAEVRNVDLRRVDPTWKGEPELPATGVTWEQADRFCRALGHRLPSEAEWEYAARGTDGRRYPWGNVDPGVGHAAFNQPRGVPGGPSATDSHPAGAGPFGTLHQAGNVSEWVADCFDPRTYRARLERNLTDAAPVLWPDCVTHVLRGGSFLDGQAKIRAAARADASSLVKSDAVGFRCAR